jgi:hypothetical protein
MLYEIKRYEDARGLMPVSGTQTHGNGAESDRRRSGEADAGGGSPE